MALVRNADDARLALERSATVLQLRDPVASARELERRADRLIGLAGATPLVISARADLALAVGAAGVHLPERDLPVAAARRMVGPGRLVGRSTHSIAAAREAEEQGADYVVFGPVFASASHPGQRPAGLTALRAVAAAVRVPVLAIGGVDAGRAAACLGAGAAGFAAIGYFTSA